MLKKKKENLFGALWVCMLCGTLSEKTVCEKAAQSFPPCRGGSSFQSDLYAILWSEPGIKGTLALGVNDSLKGVWLTLLHRFASATCKRFCKRTGAARTLPLQKHTEPFLSVCLLFSLACPLLWRDRNFGWNPSGGRTWGYLCFVLLCAIMLLVSFAVYSLSL